MYFSIQNTKCTRAHYVLDRYNKKLYKIYKTKSKTKSTNIKLSKCFA